MPSLWRHLMLANAVQCPDIMGICTVHTPNSPSLGHKGGLLLALHFTLEEEMALETDGLKMGLESDSK